MSFWCERFEVKFDVVFQLHVHDVFQQSQRNVFSTGLHFCFWKLPNVFANVFDMFLEFDEKMRMDENVFGTTW